MAKRFREVAAQFPVEDRTIADRFRELADEIEVGAAQQAAACFRVALREEL